jgi:hypothetical protein
MKLTLLTALILLSATTAFAGGWYLMEPPNQADLDASCQSGGSPFWSDYLTALRTWVMPSEVRLKRCENELYVLVPLAPVSRWIQLRGIGASGEDVSVFKDLNDCNASLGSGTSAAGMPSPELRSYAEKNYATWKAAMGRILNRLDKDLDRKNRKDWDEATRDRCRSLIPDDVEVPMGVEAFRYMTCYQEEDQYKDPDMEAQMCIAADDPRLKDTK